MYSLNSQLNFGHSGTWPTTPNRILFLHICMLNLFGTYIGQQSLANTRYHRYDKLVNRSSTIFITVRWIIEKRRLGTFFQHTRLINPNANGNTRHVNSPCLYVNFKVTYIGQKWVKHVFLMKRNYKSRTAIQKYCWWRVFNWKYFPYLLLFIYDRNIV